jgi:intergrase/recombinase
MFKSSRIVSSSDRGHIKQKRWIEGLSEKIDRRTIRKVHGRTVKEHGRTVKEHGRTVKEWIEGLSERLHGRTVKEDTRKDRERRYTEGP